MKTAEDFKGTVNRRKPRILDFADNIYSFSKIINSIGKKL
jgi:hypothetical protein